jgi:hypothetical protein
MIFQPIFSILRTSTKRAQSRVIVAQISAWAGLGVKSMDFSLLACGVWF